MRPAALPISIAFPRFAAPVFGDESKPMATFAVPEYSRNQVDKAGFLLVKPDAKAADLLDALKVLNNWRAAHAYPLLHFRINLMRLTASISNDALVAQRIKRLESIRAKLERQSTQLSQMQDIGGCRAVLSDVKDVKKLVEGYKNSRAAHQLRGEKDYIQMPKGNGYRSHHLIFSYKSARGQKAKYDGLRLEVQIRTSLQHAWATAVEAVGIFTRQALKANVGDQQWLRLFSLVSAQIAQIEDAPIVPFTPLTEEERLEEIRELAATLRPIQLLDAYNATISYIGTQNTAAKYYLMQLDYVTNSISVESFDSSASQAANMAYTNAEASINAEDKNVVLVSVDSIANLQKAYPNYFLDTAQFSRLLRTCLHVGEGQVV